MSNTQNQAPTLEQEISALLRDSASFTFTAISGDYSWHALYRVATLRWGYLHTFRWNDPDYWEMRATGPDTPDWGFQCLGGCEGEFESVLVARSPRARRALWVGRVLTLVRDHGLSLDKAKRVVEVSKGVRYSHERHVIALALELISYHPGYLASVPKWRPFKSGPHRKWVEKFDLPSQGEMSAPRYQSAWAIAKAYHQVRA